MKPNTITVVLADTLRTQIAIQFEDQHRPYRRRTVHIPLTEEQMALISPREVGVSSGKTVHEEILDSWLEER